MVAAEFSNSNKVSAIVSFKSQARGPRRHEDDLLHVRQIVRAVSFARVLTLARVIARVKRKGLKIHATQYTRLIKHC